MNIDIDDVFQFSFRHANELAKSLTMANTTTFDLPGHPSRVNAYQKLIFDFLVQDEKNLPLKMNAVEYVVGRFGAVALSTTDLHLPKERVQEITKGFKGMTPEKLGLHLSEAYSFVEDMYSRSVSSIPNKKMKI